MSTSSSKRIYNTKRWREIRARVLAAEPVCHWCGKKPSTDADHVHPLVAGGDPYDLDNLVGSCSSCNGKRGQKAYETLVKHGHIERTAKGLQGHTEPRQCAECSASFVPDRKNALRGGGRFCSQSCANFNRRGPNGIYEYRFNWSCVVCKKECQGKLTKTVQEPPRQRFTCSAECSKVRQAAMARDSYKADKPRASKYGQLADNRWRVEVQVVKQPKRADHLLDRGETGPRPTVISHSPRSSGTRPNDPETERFPAKVIEAGQIRPRIETRSHGNASYGVLVADWARRHLKNPNGDPLELFPWQARVLSGLLEHQGGQFHHRWGLVSTARQQGKTTGLLIPLIGWWLTDGRTIRGGSQSVMSVSHKLQQAEDLTRGLFPILEDVFGFQTWSTYGRKEAVGPDGTIWRITAANDNAGHGTSNDLVICDEVWNIDAQVIEGGLLPTQRARPNPLALFVSTAGDDSSVFLQRWRERGIAQAGTGEPGRLYFAEWSVPPDAAVDDRSWWPAANPALGVSPLDWQALEDDNNNLGRDEFVRTCLNRWVASVASWLPVGAWDDLKQARLPAATGGVLAVDSATDSADYAGVRAVRRDDGVVQVTAEFNVAGTDRLWGRLGEIAADHPDLDIIITPGLHAVAPAELRRRLTMWGQKEITLATEVVRNMILEGRIAHRGDALLDEHVRRAVAGRAGQTITLSSVKSPGPIHLCRCMVAAVGQAARPTSNVRKPMIGTGR